MVLIRLWFDKFRVEVSGKVRWFLSNIRWVFKIEVIM